MDMKKLMATAIFGGAFVFASGVQAETFEDVQAVFSQICAECHGMGDNNFGFQFSGLDLSSNQYENLVNVEPTQSKANNDGLLRVDPGNPDNSLLWLKVDHQAEDEDKDYGNNMPRAFGGGAGQQLDQSSLDLIKAWIEAGAPETESFEVNGTAISFHNSNSPKFQFLSNGALRFELQGRHSEMQVFLPSGKQVAVIKAKTSGNTSVFLWNGEDASGVRLQPGLYYGKLSGENGQHILLPLHR